MEAAYGRGGALRKGLVRGRGRIEDGRGFGPGAGPMEAAYERGGALRKGQVRGRSQVEGRGLWARRSFRKGAGMWTELYGGGALGRGVASGIGLWARRSFKKGTGAWAGPGGGAGLQERGVAGGRRQRAENPARPLRVRIPGGPRPNFRGSPGGIPSTRRSTAASARASS